MKVLSLALLLLLLGCQSNPSKDAQSNEPVQWLEFKAPAPIKGKRIVLVSGDEEYRSEEALPQLAKILTQHHGFDCSVLFAQDPSRPGIVNPNYNTNIPGLEQLAEADLLILFTRFRALPVEQMQLIEDYLMAGKPLIAIRTATHAFNFKAEDHPFAHYGYNYGGEKANWLQGFGKLVLGETWYSHHGHHKHQSTRGKIAEEAEGHPVLNGIADGAIWGPSDVYGIRLPLGGDAKHLVLGQTIDRAGDFDESDAFYGMRPTDEQPATQSGHRDSTFNPNAELPPIVWTKSYQLPGGQRGTSLTSTIGASTDLTNAALRRVFVNAAYHLSGLEVPAAAKVEFVGPYKPSAFAFHDDEYWEKKNLKVEHLQNDE